MFSGFFSPTSSSPPTRSSPPICFICSLCTWVGLASVGNDAVKHANQSRRELFVDIQGTVSFFFFFFLILAITVACGRITSSRAGWRWYHAVCMWSSTHEGVTWYTPSAASGSDHAGKQFKALDAAIRLQERTHMVPMSASKAVLSRMQLTLRATRRTPHGASCLVQATSAWSVKTRRAPFRHCRDARVMVVRLRLCMILNTPPPALQGVGTVLRLERDACSMVK